MPGKNIKINNSRNSQRSFNVELILFQIFEKDGTYVLQKKTIKEIYLQLHFGVEPVLSS